MQEKRILIPNRTDIFGYQLICDSEDNVIGQEENLLSNATSVSIEEAPNLVNQFGGICYPAHIDRDANGIISVLGTFPESPKFTCCEFHSSDKIKEYTDSYGLLNKHLLVNSDAHYLWDIKERSDYLCLEEITDSEKAGERVIDFLREGL